ncbi:MAG: ATP synthase F1 subunit epsilon [Clostridia bacterium]|nr:ATP synthase F1 subunit epsilon [Clostridia bacterium]
MHGFHLQLVTPDGLVFDGIADAILVRTAGGDVEIMRGHEDYFATLGTGRAKLTVDGKSRDASASGGFISVKSGEVKLVCTTFEFADDIDLARARAARERAESVLRSSRDAESIRVARAKLLRAASRIHVAELLK